MWSEYLPAWFACAVGLGIGAFLVWEARETFASWLGFEEK